MPPEPPGGTRPAGPVVLRIKLRYDDVEAMISRFAPNVGKSGLFLPTKSLQPVGAEIKFELRLANDTAVLLGLGRVKATKPPDPDNPKASFGMAIELMRVTKESRDLILRMLERRKQLGLPDVALPLPADVDASRRADLVETAIKDPASAPIPSAAVEAPSESLLTAPRRQSGPLAVQKAIEIAPLAPEAPRRKRPGLQELIDRASGPLAAVTVPGLDEEVDVGAVLARARALAGGDLDGELEALRESQATPIEIDVEAASAELARQLGGVAVRRGQSAPTSWAPPPEIAKVPTEAPAEPQDEAAPEPEASQPIEASIEASIEAPIAAPIEQPVPQLVDEEIVAPEPVEAVAEAPKIYEAVTRIGDHVPFDFDTDAPGVGEPGEEHEVEAEQIDDEIHQLAESDFEEVEHTQIGEVQNAFAEHAFATTPALQAELESKLDEQLAEAEQESEHDDLGIGEASGHYLRSKIGLPPAEIYEEPEPVAKAEVTPLPAEYQQDFIHRFADEPVDEPILQQPGFDDEVQEIDDFEILAEADEQDADLLTSSGEAEVSAHHTLPPDLAGDVPDGEFAMPPEHDGEPPLRESDFAMRLDLGDDEDEDVPAQPINLAVSAGNALAGFAEDEQSHSFRPAPALEELEAPISGFVPPGRFDQSDVIPLVAPAAGRTKRSTMSGPPPNVGWDEPPNQWKTPPPPASDEIDLESALEALDVDLDDLSTHAPVPHAPTELARGDSPQRRATIRPPSQHQVPNEKRSQRIPRGRAPRASTEDGVLIDFDDDES
jgi:hypothetical protein